MTDPTPVSGTIKPMRHTDTERNKIINRTSTDLGNIINGHDPDVDNLGIRVWDRLDQMAVEIEARTTPANVTDTAELEQRARTATLYCWTGEESELPKLLADALAALRAENERLAADKDGWIEQYRNIQKLEMAHRDLRQKAEAERDRLQAELARLREAIRSIANRLTDDDWELRRDANAALDAQKAQPQLFGAKVEPSPPDQTEVGDRT